MALDVGTLQLVIKAARGQRSYPPNRRTPLLRRCTRRDIRHPHPHHSLFTRRCRFSANLLHHSQPDRQTEGCQTVQPTRRDVVRLARWRLIIPPASLTLALKPSTKLFVGCGKDIGFHYESRIRPRPHLASEILSVTKKRRGHRDLSFPVEQQS